MEADPKAGSISCVSPVARLLMGAPALPARRSNTSNGSSSREARTFTTDNHALNRLSSFEPLTLSICLSVKSLPMLNPFVMRLLRSAACLSSA